MPTIERRLRNGLKRTLRHLFEVGQYCGVDILPRHFYSSVPDMRHLKGTDYWRKPLSMIGIKGAEPAGQFEFVEECCTSALRDRLRKGEVHSAACADNGEPGYGPIEADFLHCFIATKRPRRVVQVGAGVSTAVMLRAARESGHLIDVFCVEPYPTDFLRRSMADGRLRLLAMPAQEADLATLTDLDDGDLLFVDSTHTVKPGSEVNRLVLEVLPRLRAGVYVHFHDITFPYDYPPDILQTNFFWSEGALLQAFLICNSRSGIAASLSMLQHADPRRLRELLPNFTPGEMKDGVAPPGAPGHFPSSIYLRMSA
jgi:predicted O-methyltransferase YrrM